jgi:putative tryptophan/tyrosine transport system substrate-binding protein
MIGRRQFVTLLGGAAVAWPLAAHAQQPGKLPTIGLLGSGTAAAQSQWTAAFVTRLREVGWTERRNIAIEYRWADGRSERFAEIADEFVRLKVDVIVTHDTLPALAAKQATSAIPIVFATAGDPVGTGIAASLARPGGNITGLSSQHPDATGKRLELLRDLVPGLRRLAVGRCRQSLQRLTRQVHLALFMDGKLDAGAFEHMSSARRWRRHAPFTIR